jgi:hypothetical protein
VFAIVLFQKQYIVLYISRGGNKIFKALARLASNSKILFPKSEKNSQNHVFAEHLCSVHLVCTSPTRKIDHHDCVCIVIINKSPCQVCVCILESGRNKTQLAGKKDSLRGGKKTLAKLASKFKKLLAKGFVIYLFKNESISPQRAKLGVCLQNRTTTSGARSRYKMS